MRRLSVGKPHRTHQPFCCLGVLHWQVSFTAAQTRATVIAITNRFFSNSLLTCADHRRADVEGGQNAGLLGLKRFPALWVFWATKLCLCWMPTAFASNP